MKNKTKLIFLAVVLGTLGMSTQATTVYNQDLLVGFTQSSGNDLIYDLGAESALANGKTWNLSTLLTSYTLSTVRWGVIGDNKTAQTPQHAVYTTLQNPGPLNGTGQWSPIDTATKGIYQAMPAAGAGQYESVNYLLNQNTWYYQMESPSLTTQYGNAYGNPDVTGLTSVSFSQVLNDGSAATVIGQFTLGSNGVLTYNTVSPAPPTPQIVSAARTNSTSTIRFTTATGTYTYTLYYTNSSGLLAPVATWPSSPTTVIGNGLTNSLTDTTTDTNRFYRIGVH